MSDITIREIAKMADVSIGTVDRVLHNRGNVKKEKADRILEICRQMNYEPNILARAMMLRKKNLKVAVVMEAPGESVFHISLRDGLNRICEEWKDYNISLEYLYMKEQTWEEQADCLEQMSEQMYDGLIIKPVNHPRIRELLEKLKESGMPVVTCTSELEHFTPLCYVGQNHEREGRMAANMLLKCLPNLEKTLILTIEQNVLARVQKIKGFQDYLAGHRNGAEVLAVIEYREDAGDVYKKTLEAMKRYREVQALYAHTRYLDAVYQAVKEMGREQDTVVFSFGYYENVGRYLKEGKITFAIEENPYRHGYLAGKEIFNYLVSNKMPDQERRYVKSQILIEESVEEYME